MFAERPLRVSAVSAMLLLFTSLHLLLMLAPTSALSSADAAADPFHFRLPRGPATRPVAPLFRPRAIPPPTMPPPTSVIDSSFNETVSLDLLLYSSAAYSSAPSRCTSRYHPSFNVTHTFNSSLYDTALFGYAGVDDSEQSLVFAFQGSMDVEQLWEELLHDDPVNATVGGAMLVNQYFYVGSVGLLPLVSAAYTELTGRYSNYTVYFTGHSLGGALAHVLSYLLTSASTAASSSSQPITLYTFGQPRTGNAAFATTSSLYVPSHYRVVHWRDVIPHLPPCPTQRGAGGLEVCSAGNSTTGYYAYHAPQEVWYTSNMPALNSQQPRSQQREASLHDITMRTGALPPPPPPQAWTACTGPPTGEDQTCSDGLDWYWINDHYYYYQVEVGDLCTMTRERRHEEGRVLEMVH